MYGRDCLLNFQLILAATTDACQFSGGLAVLLDSTSTADSLLVTGLNWTVGILTPLNWTAAILTMEIGITAKNYF